MTRKSHQAIYSLENWKDALFGMQFRDNELLSAERAQKRGIESSTRACFKDGRLERRNGSNVTHSSNRVPQIGSSGRFSLGIGGRGKTERKLLCLRNFQQRKYSFIDSTERARKLIREKSSLNEKRRRLRHQVININNYLKSTKTTTNYDELNTAGRALAKTIKLKPPALKTSKLLQVYLL